MEERWNATIILGGGTPGLHTSERYLNSNATAFQRNYDVTVTDANCGNGISNYH